MHGSRRLFGLGLGFDSITAQFGKAAFGGSAEHSARRRFFQVSFQVFLFEFLTFTFFVNESEEVIGIVAAFLKGKPLFQVVLGLVVFAQFKASQTGIEIRTRVTRTLDQNFSPDRNNFLVLALIEQSLTLFEQLIDARLRGNRGFLRFGLDFLYRFLLNLCRLRNWFLNWRIHPSLGDLHRLRLGLFPHRFVFHFRFGSSLCHGIVFRILRAFGFGLGLLAQRFVNPSSTFVGLAHRGIVAVSQTEIGKSATVVLHLHADLRSQVIRFGISRIVGQDGAVFPEGLFIFALRLEAGSLFYTRVGSKRRRKTNQYSKSKYGS